MTESLVDRKIQGLFTVADDKFYGTLLAKVLLSRESRKTKRRSISNEQEKRSLPKEKPSQTPTLGIPSFDLSEKITSVVPVKLQPSLKRAIPKPQSSWIRRIIIEKLTRETEEAC